MYLFEQYGIDIGYVVIGLAGVVLLLLIMIIVIYGGRKWQIIGKGIFR